MKGTIRIDDDLGIAEVALAIARRGGIERIWFLFYEVDAVVADGIAQLLVYLARAVDEAGSIKGIELTRMIRHRAGADGFFPGFVDAEDHGILFPCLEIAGNAERPLMAAEPP